MFIITLMFFLHNTSAQNTEVQGTFSDRFTCIMLQKTPWDQGFVCVWVGRRLKGEGRGGGGVSAREPTDMFSTSASAARLEMRRNMEVEWQIGEGEREPSLMWSLLPWHMYSQQKVLRSSICSASLLYPARLRTELDLEHQDAAESGLNIKGQSYCMSKRRLRRGANNTAYSAWDAATWHDDRLLLVFFTVYGDRQTYYTSPNKARVVPRGSRHVLFCCKKDLFIMLSCDKRNEYRWSHFAKFNSTFKNKPLCSHPVRLFAPSFWQQPEHQKHVPALVLGLTSSFLLRWLW